ncbi:Fur family transcriptional regulator [Aestuariimicrobium ganziense]|uniref:Fur family transcriptional regulator n=1 Tax=Aestuariimicrobium ganziense TaxID=2773677 RepID=UPI0019423BB6|nr:Fur family transcriptional regulator [Aestuariimicrobium ganziense]
MPDRLLSADSPAAAEALRQAGLRITRQRLAVIDAIRTHPHASVDEILEQLGAGASITRQAIYLIVADLSQAGIVRRLDLPGHASRYELDEHDNHHHAVCDSCGLVLDVPCHTGSAPCLEAPVPLALDVRVADVVYRGLCRDCTTTELPAASSRTGRGRTHEGE